MKDVSSLMDGELDRRKARSTIARLEQKEDLWDAWATFHVIRDALQGNAVGPSRFVERFHERLEHEPVPASSNWRPPRARAVTWLAAGAAVVLLLAVLIWVLGGAAGSDRQARSAGDSAPPPVAEARLTDTLAIEFAMAHRQLVPAFVSDQTTPEAAASARAAPAAKDGTVPVPATVGEP